MYEQPENKAKLLALYCEEAVAWVFVNFETTWQVSCLWSLVFAEVVDSLLLATAQNDVLRV